MPVRKWRVVNVTALQFDGMSQNCNYIRMKGKSS